MFGPQNFQLSALLIQQSFLQKLNAKKRKTVINKNSKTDKTRKALFWPPKLMLLSRLRLIRKKTMIKTGIV